MEKKVRSLSLTEKNQDLPLSWQGEKYPSPIHKVCGLFSNKDLHSTSGRKPKSVAMGYLWGSVLHFLDQQLGEISFPRMVLGFFVIQSMAFRGSIITPSDIISFVKYCFIIYHLNYLPYHCYITFLSNLQMSS